VVESGANSAWVAPTLDRPQNRPRTGARGNPTLQARCLPSDPAYGTQRPAVLILWVWPALCSPENESRGGRRECSSPRGQMDKTARDCHTP
jgi:hypothetical protein